MSWIIPARRALWLAYHGALRRYRAADPASLRDALLGLALLDQLPGDPGDLLAEIGCLGGEELADFRRAYQAGVQHPSEIYLDKGGDPGCLARGILPLADLTQKESV